MQRFLVSFWCRAGAHCDPSNKLYIGAQETFWKGSLLISGFHDKHQTGQCLHIVLGFIYSASDKLAVGKLKGARAIYYGILQNSRGIMRTHILTAYWMAAKPGSQWIAKTNKLNQNHFSFPSVRTARLSLGRGPLWYIEVVKRGVSACKSCRGCKSLHSTVIKGTMRLSCG